MAYRGTFDIVGDKDEPSYIYYNADIINNTTADIVNGASVVDPPVRFLETRDTAILKDASKYHFSIVRFSMNGPNLDLPLFIPDIQEGTGQTNVNLTTYGAAISYQQTWSTTNGIKSFNIVPAPRFLVYTPEFQNPVLAPIPRPMNNPRYLGIYNPATTYVNGDIVGTGVNLYGSGVGPYYEVKTPDQWNSLTTYAIGNVVMYRDIMYRAIAVPPVGVAPVVGPNWVVGIVGIAPTNTFYWKSIADSPGNPQDLSSRYYWVITYDNWVQQVNNLLLQCHQDTFAAFQVAWVAAATGDPFPYANFAAFQAVMNTPKIIFDEPSLRFKMFGDSDAFGPRLSTFTPVIPPALGPTTAPVCRVFFNNNLYGLFPNFQTVYWNTTNPAISPFAGLPIWVNTILNGPGTPTPVGYAWEVQFTNKFFTNVADYSVAPYTGYVPVAEQKKYWITEQDWASTDTLWSPISSIVFTSTLLPIRAEATGPPVVLGTGNLGDSAPTVRSAFQPIITDVSLPLAGDGAKSYREFIYYSPQAQYRLSDFEASKAEIRAIDIQVWWKNRLDNELYPITMFNGSSVSLKIMFQHRDALGVKEALATM